MGACTNGSWVGYVEIENQLMNRIGLFTGQVAQVVSLAHPRGFIVDCSN